MIEIILLMVFGYSAFLVLIGLLYITLDLVCEFGYAVLGVARRIRARYAARREAP